MKYFDIGLFETSKWTKCYFNTFYTGFKTDNNPDFLNYLKNTFNNESKHILEQSMEKVEEIIATDFFSLLSILKWDEAVVITVPRAKKEESYTINQQLFRKSVSNAVSLVPNLIDGTNALIREIDTKTTHFKRTINPKRIALMNSSLVEIHGNTGSEPYQGIIRDTCKINIEMFKDKKVILVDDIYTKGVNIDEDAILTIYEIKKKKVILYVVAKTER